MSKNSNNMIPTARLAELKKMSLFVNLSNREMSIVSGFMHDRTYLKDEIVFDAGEDGQAIYMLLEGRLLVCHPRDSERILAEIESGGFFGELALLDDGPRSAQVRAAENSSVVVLFRGDFRNLMESHALIASKIALQLANHLGKRLRRAMGEDQQAVL